MQYRLTVHLLIFYNATLTYASRQAQDQYENTEVKHEQAYNMYSLENLI